MEKQQNPLIGFNKDARDVLVALLRRTIVLIRFGGINVPVDVGIVAAHLRDFCTYLDGHDCEHSDTGFHGGFNGNVTWAHLCEKLQETSNVDWHNMLSEYLDSGEWPKPKTSEPTISIDTKEAV